MQKFAPGWRGFPQFGHTVCSFAPQFMQKFAPGCTGFHMTDTLSLALEVLPESA